jgi:hypothetical protein
MADLQTIASKLAKLLPLLASDKPGEVAATAAAINRTLAAAGADLHDLASAIEGLSKAAPKARRQRKPASRPAGPDPERARSAQQPKPRQYYTEDTKLWADLSPAERLALAQQLLDSEILTLWEIDLVSNIRAQVREWPHARQSERQQAVLDRLAATLRLKGARRYA